MSDKKLDRLILQLENYLECWKQFNHYLNVGRSKKFDAEDESQFLEVKSIITQELELILYSVEADTPTKSDVHLLISSAPSIRYLSELNEGALRGIENQWHKLYISWQSLLGQLKVQQRRVESQSLFKKIFGKKEA